MIMEANRREKPSWLISLNLDASLCSREKACTPTLFDVECENKNLKAKHDIGICVHTHVGGCVCIYIYTYIHTYMHACIHTYIHTYVCKSSYRCDSMFPTDGPEARRSHRPSPGSGILPPPRNVASARPRNPCPTLAGGSRA